MRRRLIVLAAATTSLVVLAFVVPLALLVRSLAEDRAVRPAQLGVQALAPLAAVAPRELPAAVDATAGQLGEDVSVLLGDGTVLGAPLEAAEIDRLREVRTTRVIARPDGSREAVAVAIQADGSPAVVRAVVPADRVTAGVAESWALLGGLGVLLIVGAVVIADRLARRTLVAVHDLEETARRLSSGDLDARTSVADPPEVARVAEALDVLATRIVDLLVAERESAADLSHRLRTPLTALRLDAEALPHGSARDEVLADVDSLQVAVDQVIADARAGREHRGVVDLAAIVAERVEFWRVLADDEQRPFTATLPERAPVRAVASQLTDAVDAILSNVFTHTPDGAPIDVRIDHHSDRWHLVVSDGGAGFPEGIDVLSRGVSGAGSTGLGLDIARRAADDLRVGRSDLGGAEIEMIFAVAGDRASEASA